MNNYTMNIVLDKVKAAIIKWLNIYLFIILFISLLLFIDHLDKFA